MVPAAASVPPTPVRHFADETLPFRESAAQAYRGEGEVSVNVGLAHSFMDGRAQARGPSIGPRNGGEREMTIFTKISASIVSQANLQAQIGQHFERRGAVEGAEIAGRYRAKINSVNFQAKNWRNLADDLQGARGNIKSVVLRIKSIKASIDRMMSFVQNANNDTEANENPTGYARAFDSTLRCIVGKALSDQTGNNLIGKADAARLSYPVNIYGTTREVRGAFLGTDYHIIDSQGKRWSPDWSARLLRQYDEYPDKPSDKMGDFYSGVRVDSISGTTVGFTIAPNTAAPESFTGTLNRDGLGLLDAWYYDGLATAAGRDRAMADLESARLGLDLEIRRYEIVGSTIGFYEQKAKASVGGYEKRVASLLAEKAKAFGIAEERLARDYAAAARSVVAGAALRQRYAKIFHPDGGNAFTKILIDVNA